MADIHENSDSGLQMERTALAWDRTNLALMVVAGILLRFLGASSAGLVGLVPAAGFILGLTLLVLGRTRYLGRWRRIRAGRGVLSVGPVVSVAVATLLMGLTAIVVIVVGAI